jgi:HEAT repeat protein
MMQAGVEKAEPAGSPEPQPEAMTPTLMGRLFIVPAIIVCVMLAVAVVVVMFGTTTIDKQASISDLIDRLEQDPGERTMSMLLPRAKESWQAAQELAHRFEQKDKFLKADEIEPTAQRMVALLAKYPAGLNTEDAGPPQQYFVMLALAKLGSPTAVEPLTALLKDANWNTRRTALAALAEMKGVPQAKAALPAVYPLLNDEKPAVQIVACATIATLADRGDPVAIQNVAGRLESDREISWNAAMTLARLGSDRGKLVLMNILERGFWEGLDLDYVEDGAAIRRKYSPLEVEKNLSAAIDAAASLKDVELSGLIEKLTNDPSVIVRNAARASVTSKAGALASNIAP